MPLSLLKIKIIKMKKLIIKLSILVFACGIFTINLLEIKSGQSNIENIELNELLKSASANGESVGMHGRPLMYSGGGYCCAGSGGDCGAAAC